MHVAIYFSNQITTILLLLSTSAGIVFSTEITTKLKKPIYDKQTSRCPENAYMHRGRCVCNFGAITFDDNGKFVCERCLKCSDCTGTPYLCGNSKPYPYKGKPTCSHRFRGYYVKFGTFYECRKPCNPTHNEIEVNPCGCHNRLCKCKPGMYRDHVYKECTKHCSPCTSKHHERIPEECDSMPENERCSEPENYKSSTSSSPPYTIKPSFTKDESPTTTLPLQTTETDSPSTTANTTNHPSTTSSDTTTRISVTHSHTPTQTDITESSKNPRNIIDEPSEATPGEPPTDNPWTNNTVINVLIVLVVFIVVLIVAVVIVFFVYGKPIRDYISKYGNSNDEENKPIMLDLTNIVTLLNAKVSVALQDTIIMEWGTNIKNAFNQIFNESKISNVRESFAERVFGTEYHQKIALYVDGEGDHLFYFLKGERPEYTLCDFIGDVSDVGIEKHLIVKFINVIKDL
ncbi:uncharacterized protein [Clytia hemisphaerica]|uniref:Uncharacterized protein n=1 Tax=Clytia hemisphaerica TaxID=252671 RepID=A0A7M5XIL1_9CNID